MGVEYETALLEIPPVFYERRMTMYGVGLIALVGVMTAQDVGGGDLPSYILPIASSATYVIGRIMDRLSTIKALEVMQRADELGITYPFTEQNPYLPEKLSPEELQHHPQKYVDFAVSALCPIVPPWGFAIGLSSGFVALNNSRKTKRLQRAIKMSKDI